MNAERWLGPDVPPAVVMWRCARRVWARWAERGVRAVLAVDVRRKGARR